ncbi:MAG: hypothetical protein CVT60_00750 [Actinobacteria bacterium HGW-Actinobacteria-10]|jgi:hypothetical protein|nr:MAG: hypothetical protein CVT60_00750 [Actinobacteria bacterium HGW-Actinobacteria-10]
MANVQEVARWDVDLYVETVGRQACERHGVPKCLSAEAAQITIRRFRSEYPIRLDKRGEARIRAYFYAIVRTRAIGSRGDQLRELRSRFLLSSIAADLLDAGRSGPEVFDEIVRDYSACVEPEALHALEQRLCG